MTDTELLKLQEDIEGHGIALGVQNARRALERDMAGGTIYRNRTVRDIMDTSLARTSESLKVWLDTEQERLGRPHRLKVYVDLLGVDTVAYIALAAACNAVADRRRHRDVCLAIGERIEDEARYAILKAEKADLYNYRMGKLKRTLSRRFIKASMDHTVAYAGVDTTLYELPYEEKAAIGLSLLDGIVVPVTGLFDVSTRTVNVNRKIVQDKTISWSMAATDVMWARVEDGSSFWLPPVALPCVIPPRPWGPEQRGGYHFKLAGKYPLVRKGGAKRNKATRETASAVLWEALNHLQSVEWCINSDVLRVMRTALNSPSGGFGFPPALSQIPKRLPDAAYALLSEEKLRQMRTARRIAYEQRQLDIAERADALRLLTTAARYEDKTMYFPYSLDFRGRIYAIASYLTPYGSDRHRGLLLFANGKALGPSGRHWLAVHGANTIDKLDDVKVSKLSNAERVAFVEARSDLIAATGRDPLGNSWWGDLENPWQTLAFCIEWSKLRDHEAAGGSAEDFISRLPVQMDGSCNGAQHFAALFRDETGGAAVNLVPSMRPEDLYSRVVDALLAHLKAEGEAGDRMADEWYHSGLLDRSFVKRPVMTYFYGSKQYGFNTQLKDLIKGDPKLLKAAILAFGYLKNKETGAITDKPAYPSRCSYLAKHLETALADVVKGAHDGMLWFQGWARLYGKRNLRMGWVVPVTGMAPEQAYMLRDVTQVETTMFGKRIKATAWNDSDTVNGRKQVTAISPNVIHSLDTAHLMITLSMLPEVPVAAVHDSYWSRAGDTDLLRAKTREAFVQFHELDIADMLERQFAEGIPDATPDELAAIPAKPAAGTLDIRGVLESEYFFA